MIALNLLAYIEQRIVGAVVRTPRLRHEIPAGLDARLAGLRVDAILRRGVIDAGLRTSFDNISGYTLGFYAQAGPRTSDFTRIFHPGAAWRLEANMVFHMYIIYIVIQ